MIRPPRWLPSAFCLMSLAACTSWRTQPLKLLQRPLRPRDRVQIWSRGEAYDVHGVVVRGDSVWAVRFFQPVDCQRCRLVFAVRDVDSLRMQQPDHRRSAGLAIGLVATVLIAAIVAGASGLAAAGALGGG